MSIARWHFCTACKVKGHTIKNCPKMGNPRDTDGPILPTPTHIPPQDSCQLHIHPDAPDMLESDLLPLQSFETATEMLDIPLLPTFWSMFGIRNYPHLYEFVTKVHSIAKANLTVRNKHDNLDLTFEMFKNQETPQQKEDMFISFAAIGILSKLIESKCKILVKGKTGLFLCADMLQKSGELRGVVTDDIDLVILAKQTSPRDPSRKLFAQQVGAFITFCLREKYNTVSRRTSRSAKSAAAANSRQGTAIFSISEDVSPCLYLCSDIIIRGEGVCGSSIESRNVKVSFDTGNGRKVKLVDITYTTYNKQIDRLYSRFVRADISPDVSYFYLDVKTSIMEYVFIILDNVTKCNEFVKTHGKPEVRLKDVMHPQDKKLLEDRAAAASCASCGSSAALPCAAEFMDNLSDFEQAIMFKFAKSAHLCASIIAEFPEFHNESHTQEQKWELQKIIVMMQLYELSRHDIIPRKFTRVMIQTQDLLQEMLTEVILHKHDDPTLQSAVNPHKHLTERLQSIQTVKTTRPVTSFDTTRFVNVPLGVHLSAFDIRQIVDNPLTSPDTSPTSEKDDPDTDRVTAADAHKIYQRNKEFSKQASTRKKALQTVPVRKRPGASAGTAGLDLGEERWPALSSSSSSRRSQPPHDSQSTSKKESSDRRKHDSGMGGGSRRRRQRTLHKRRR